MSIKFNIKQILVPTDFSDLSLSALHHAAAIAKHSDAEIILLHVMETYEQNVELNQAIHLDDVIKEAVNKKLTEIKNENIDLWGIPIKAELRKGKIYNVIQDVIKEKGVDLVVMGTQGYKNIEKKILGTNAYRTVLYTKCPVITIKKPKDIVKFNKLVLPLDTTKDTKQKVASAIKIAKVFNSEVHIISISTFIEGFTTDAKKLERNLEEVASLFAKEGIKVKTKVMANEVVTHAVMEYSNRIKADLILIMTRQEGKINELFVGSSAKKLITESDVPILSFKPKG